MNDFNQLLKFPIVHPSITHQNKGIYANQHIPSGTIIMETLSSNTLFEENPTISSQFDVKDCRLLFCLIWLKKNIPPTSQDKYQWIHSNTSGYVCFSHELIKASNDEDLFIEYVAYKNKLKHQAKLIFISHGKLLTQLLNIHSLQQFTNEYIWASEFRNTRGFGFTSQTLMIPYIDYMNYDPAKSAKTKFVHFDTQQQICLQETGKQAQIDDSESSDEEGLENVRKYVGIVTTDNIQKGQQILFRYGAFSNRYLLQWYGYVCENNPFDKVIIYIKNHPSTNMISFSQVERSTTSFAMRRKKLNQKMIDHWQKVTHQSIAELATAMKKADLPRISEKLKLDPNYEWIELYQREQAAIFQSHLQLLETMVSQ